ncbi:MAG: pectate lyase [Alphaproteobacteria bacterium]|nr:pectate lyase [Alphaproteobacteria bacterium]
MREYERFAPGQYVQIADNLIAYQNDDGGWPKNIDWLANVQPGDVVKSIYFKKLRSTVDNWNTYTQIEYLAQVYVLTARSCYKDAALRGLQYLLNTQDSHGAWWGSDFQGPTLNDNATTGVLRLFLKIVQGDENFNWLSQEWQEKIALSLTRGIDFLLKSQIVQSGVKTAWAQQYTMDDLQPAKGRKYELPAISVWESCNVLELLMEIHEPSPQVINAVGSAILWLKSVQINGLRLEQVKLKEKVGTEYPYDLVIINDDSARPIWARYYELVDNTPFMCTKQGKKVYSLSELDYDRRVGYTWYGYWPEKIFEKYDGWSMQYMTTNINYNK